MPKEPSRYYDVRQSEEEFKRRQEIKAKRRKKRQLQRVALLGGMAVAVLLIILVPVLLFTNCGSCAPAPPPSSSTTLISSSAEPAVSEPLYPFPVAPDPAVWNLKLVNLNQQLPEQFNMVEGAEEGQIASVLVRDGVPVTSGGNDHYYFDNRIVASLLQMINDCNAVEGHSLRILSGYRGWNTQETRYTTAYQALITGGMSAEEATVMVERTEPGPGRSEHQIGLAAAFGTGTVQTMSADFASTNEYQWLVENAANYGFILRYTEEYSAVTGMEGKPYHWRYVGVDDAHAIAGSGICLEMYLLQFPEGYDYQAAYENAAAGGAAPTGDAAQGSSVPSSSVPSSSAPASTSG